MASILEAFENWLKDHWLLFLAFIFAYFAWRFDFAYDIIKGALPIIGIIVLGRIAWTLWVHYIQHDFISGISWVVLEVIPPREVLRSPKAMELFLTNALYQWSMKGGKEEFWQGAVWFWFSLEIVSIDGQVHFYIRVPTRLQGLVETQMYAQYPQAQVRVAEDYTLAVDEISPKSKWMGWGCEFKLEKPEAYPIKTYVDFGLDKDPKEEFKVDPISPVVELFGSLKKGEQMWLQIVITPSKKMYKTHGTWFGKHDWVVQAKKELLSLQSPYTSTRVSADDPHHYGIEVRTPEHLKNMVKRMNDKVNKLGFEAGIRAMYIAPKEVYDMSSRRNLRLIFRQYSNPDSNSLVRTNSTQGDALGSSIMSLSQEKVMILANRMLEEYRERNFFHDRMRQKVFSEHRFSGGPFNIIGIISKQFFLPFVHAPTFVLNTEEIATLWHFPGQILKVPTLERIESKEASPPTNLPT